MDVVVLPDPAAVADQAAHDVIALATAALELRGRCLLALSGGSTPRAMYARLVSESRASGFDWSRVEFFWSDERAVPPGDSESNYRMALETLLEPLGIAGPQIHRMAGEADDLEAAADGYARLLQERADATVGGAPVLDLVLLGMGADGHTASLFPRTPALDETERTVVPNRAPRPPVSRLTVTFPVIHAARAVRVLVTGADKARTLEEVLHGPHDPARLPSQRLAGSRGDLRWLVDAAAAHS